jgi:hypothetical protein
MSSSSVTSPDKNSLTKSDQWSLLYSELQNSHVDRDVFDELHTFIAPPPELKSFATIAANLIRIFPCVQSILSFESKPDRNLIRNLSLWTTYCESIVSSQKDIERVIPSFCDRGKVASQPPQHGSYKFHPLSVALWCSVSDPALSERYVLLQAYLCLAHNYLRVLEDKKGYRYGNSKLRACRAVRKLSNPNFANILRDLPDEIQPFIDYLEAVELLEGDDDFHYLYMVFSNSLKGKKGITRQRITNGLHSKTNISGPFRDKTQTFVSKDDDEDDSSGELVTVLTLQTGTKSEIMAQKRLACSPDEFTAAREAIICEETGPDPSGGLDRRQQALKAKGSLSAIAMNNQRIGTDWDILTPDEIATFLRSIKNMCHNNHKDVFQEFEGIPTCELMAFLSILFWTSTTPEIVKQCTLVPAAARSNVQLGIQWKPGEDGYWVIKPRVPKQDIVPARLLKKQALSPAARYTLPIPSQALSVMERHLSTFPAGFEPIEIFDRDVKDYKRTAKALLQLMRRNGSRQSLQRLSGYMHDLITRMPGSDVTVAMAITGNNDILGSVPLHYTAIGLERIEDLYANACSTVLAHTSSEDIPALRQIAACRPSDDQPHVGSRFVPRQQTIVKFIKDTRDRINNAREKIETVKQLPVEFHNDITVYTVMMLGFATGYRAVHDPLLQEAEFDRTTGFAVISDKDGDDFYNSRIVWLPGFCLKQLDYYNEHLALLQKKLFHYNQELFFKVRQKSVTGRQSNRYNPSLFILEENCNDLSLQPKTLQLLITNAKYFLPVNSNRHYLRTNLLALGCPIEVINALMGHWIRGIEPWGRYSGLSPLVYREELIKHLVPLLEEDGWGPEQGLGILGDR